VASLLIGAVAPACHRSRPVAFARLVDQATSWAASVEFAEEMRTAGNVPRAYVDDLLQDGVAELTALEKKAQSFDEVAPAIRSEAASLCGRLARVVDSAVRSHSEPDLVQLRALEARLRDLAQAMRSGGVPAVDGGPR
jgi:hypothetical protein